MPFSNEQIGTTGSEPKNKVYVKGIQPGLNKSKPFFEVNMSDGTKTEHKTMLNMDFVSAEPHVYQTEEWGDKQQMHIVLKDEDGTQYDLFANWNSITRAMYNAIASEKNIDKISIVFNYSANGDFYNTQVFINGSDKAASWAFSGDEYHSRVSVTTVAGKDIKDYTKLDSDISERMTAINSGSDLAEQLEEMASKVEPAKKKTTKSEDDSELPF